MKKIKSNGLFLLILFIVTRNGLYSIDLNSFCKTDQLKCTGNYDSGFKYEILCKNTKCHGKFGFECLNQICSKSKKGCLNLKSNRLWSIWTPYTIKLNQKSERTIQKCPHVPYTLDISDVCSQIGRSCVLKQNFFWNKVDADKQIRCPCPKDYSYECGSNYCSSDSKVCDAFNKNMVIGRDQVKKCQSRYKKRNPKLIF